MSIAGTYDRERHQRVRRSDIPWPGRVWSQGQWRDPNSQRGRQAIAKGATVCLVQTPQAAARKQYTRPSYNVTDPDSGRAIDPPTLAEPPKPRADGPTGSYVVAFVNSPDHPIRPDKVVSIKVGTTASENRSAYGMTLGLGVEQLVDPALWPNRARAELDARLIEAALDGDELFVRVGREAFAPAQDFTIDVFKSLMPLIVETVRCDEVRRVVAEV